jgi:hypothetical protein
MTHNLSAPRSVSSGAHFNALAVQSMIPPQLLDALRQVAEHPLGRLSIDEEHALSELGLLRVWNDFIVVTELGRKLLDDQADNP